MLPVSQLKGSAPVDKAGVTANQAAIKTAPQPAARRASLPTDNAEYPYHVMCILLVNHLSIDEEENRVAGKGTQLDEKIL